MLEGISTLMGKHFSFGTMNTFVNHLNHRFHIKRFLWFRSWNFLVLVNSCVIFFK